MQRNIFRFLSICLVHCNVNTTMYTSRYILCVNTTYIRIFVTQILLAKYFIIIFIVKQYHGRIRCWHFRYMFFDGRFTIRYKSKSKIFFQYTYEQFYHSILIKFYENVYVFPFSRSSLEQCCTTDFQRRFFFLYRCSCRDHIAHITVRPLRLL